MKFSFKHSENFFRIFFSHNCLFRDYATISRRTQVSIAKIIFFKIEKILLHSFLIHSFFKKNQYSISKNKKISYLSIIDSAMLAFPGDESNYQAVSRTLNRIEQYIEDPYDEDEL